MRSTFAMTGRLGAVLIAIALALLVATTIPPRANSISGFLYPQPELFVLVGGTSYSLSPQQTLHLTLNVLNVTGELDFFLVNSDFDFFNNWVITQNRDPNASSPYNSKTLTAFIQAYPASVILDRFGINNVDYVFSPGKIMTVIPIVSNPTGITVWSRFVSTVTDQYLPIDKGYTSIEIMLPIGLGLASVWSVKMWNHKTRLK